MGQGEKYRPATWDELVGNGATAARTLRAIEDKLWQDRPFGSLFAGEAKDVGRQRWLDIAA
ncbi:MAG: hypothetical protein ABSF90_15145 [Syntrophobacteraceae bacterium]